MLLYMEELQATFRPFQRLYYGDNKEQPQIEGYDENPSGDCVSLVWVLKRSAGLCEILQRLGNIAVVGESRSDFRCM
jgi:hypothetical protein